MGRITLPTPKQSAAELYPCVEGDEIHRQIESMLAATEAIKPEGSSAGSNHAEKAGPLSTRLNLLSRIAKFFGRLVGKRGAPRRRAKREHKKGASDQSPGARPVISGPLELLPPAPRGGEGFKKHPSPSIQNLEALRRHLELGEEHDGLSGSE